MRARKTAARIAAARRPPTRRPPAPARAAHGSVQICSGYRAIPTRSLASFSFSLATRLTGRCHGPQYGAHDVAGESSRVRLQLRHGLLFILLHGRTRLLDLFLSPGTGLIDGLGAGLGCLLAASFLVLENLLARFAEALFVVGGTSLSGGDIGARLFQGTLGPAAAFGEHGGERAMDQERVEDVERPEEDDRGHGS